MILDKFIRLRSLILPFLFALAFYSLSAEAELAGDKAFESAEWNMVFEDRLEMGIVQSICATKNYIVALENVDESANNPDILKAYYRYDHDKEGNKVEQYSLAERVQTSNYEHCNGMAYNPNTNEIIISLYTSANSENRGCVFLLDGDSFELKNKVKITDDYNILGIDYSEETNQYVIQTNAEGGYSFKILDESFNVIEDLGEYLDTAPGDNFQDLCVSGDYIINFPLTLDLGIGDLINVYSISRKEMVGSYQLDFGFTDVTWDEPESICELEPGKFLAAVNVITSEGERMIRYYQTEVPYNHGITVVKNAEGEEAKEVDTVLRGDTFSVDYSPEDGYKVEQVLIDGKPVEIKEKNMSLNLTKIQAEHVIKIIYAKKSLTGIFVIAFASIVIVAMIIFLMIHVRIERQRKRQQARRRRQRLLLESA